MRPRGWSAVLVFILGCGSLVAPPAAAGGSDDLTGAVFQSSSAELNYEVQLEAFEQQSDTLDSGSITDEFDGKLEKTLANGDQTLRAKAKATNQTTIVLGDGDPEVEDVFLHRATSQGSISGSTRSSEDTEEAQAQSDSEFGLGFRVAGAAVMYVIDGSLEANNSDPDGCTEGIVELRGEDTIFERTEKSGVDCNETGAPIGSTSGLLPPGTYDLDVDMDGYVYGEGSSENYSGSYNVSLTLFPACTHLGGDGGEVINGGGGDDVICAGGGNDTIDAGPGEDIVFGDDGDDEIEGGTGRDEIFGGNGDDAIEGDGSGSLTAEEGDFIDGGPGDDSIAGSPGDDFILGGGGLDTIEGGAGDDGIQAGPGERQGQPNSKDLVFGLCAGCDQSDLNPGETDNDTISGDEGPDRVLGGPDNDLIIGGAGSDELFGEQGDEIYRLPGSPREPGILGGGGRDDIKGGPGDDFAHGGEGNDDMTGQGGLDKLLGQGDEDDIIGGPNKDVLDGGGQNDFINSRDCIRDVVRGGPGGQDRAKIDERDEVSGVEGATGINC